MTGTILLSEGFLEQDEWLRATLLAIEGFQSTLTQRDKLHFFLLYFGFKLFFKETRRIRV